MNAATTSLADTQNHLLASIFARHVNLPSRGLTAYRANAHASAERALAAAFPVIAQLIGQESFASLSRDFWHQQPPLHGDLAQWGDALPAFLQASSQLADTPYLADVARIEWAMHRCAHAADAVPDIASFAALQQHAPPFLQLRLASGVQILPSTYPATAIVLAHSGQGRMEDAAALLRNGVAQTALVWRQGFAPRVRALPDAEVSFTDALCQGHRLAQALDAADPGFDFSAWLTAQVQSALLLGVDVLSNEKC